jgi:gluconokinase
MATPDSLSPTFVIVMGVSGCGKTTIAELVAAEIGGRFLEGDAFHPPANKAKMGSGIPLTDEDRRPWFDTLVAESRTVIDQGVSPVLACSALKQRYRDYLVENFARHRLVYLKGSYELIKGRMDAREHEYMTSTLLKSQFDTLEEPAEGPAVLVLPIEEPPDTLVRRIVAWLRQS